jgi:drug/metabolite transporter (DMT)-like permease/uncharacterized protein YjiS (DUF1127 family)
MSLAPSLSSPRTKFNPMPIYIGLFCLFWSFGFVAGKIGVADCPPLILLTLRFSLAGVLILTVSALRGEECMMSWRDTVVFAILGVANNALYLGFGYTGLKTVSAGLGSLIVSANPVFTSILAAAFLGESLTWRKVLGLLLGISGVSMIVWHRVSIGADSLHGLPFTLAALASIVGGIILFKLLAPQGSLWIGNGIQNLAGGLALLPFALMFSDGGDIVPSVRLFGAFAFLVLGGSILANLLWFHLLKVCGTSAASAYHFLMPPLGMFFAWLVLGEHVEARDLLGIIPVALGIYLVTRPSVVTAPPPSKASVMTWVSKSAARARKRSILLMARLRRLVNGRIAAEIARHERRAAKVALCRLDDRELKDFGVCRCQIDGAVEQAATFQMTKKPWVASRRSCSTSPYSQSR